MSNFLYDKARKRLLEASINWTTDDIRAWLVRTNQGAETNYYTPAADHEFATSISSTTAGIVAGGANGQSLTWSSTPIKVTDDGAADADDVTFASVGAGLIVRAYVLFKYTGSLATSPLILFVDQATGLTSGLTANGGNIILAWDDGTNKIFRP
jgi:hypothetical protein